MSKCNNFNCCNTIKNDCYYCNCNHFCSPQSFIQLYDKTLVNELTESQRFLSLANDKTKRDLYRNNVLSSPDNQSFSTGGYTLSTTTIKNDTLNLPGPGVYQISLSFQNTALANELEYGIGTSIPFTYSVIYNGGSASVTVPSYMVPTATIPSDMVQTATIPSSLLNSLIVYNLNKSNEKNPSLRIYLEDFDFSKVLNNKLIVDNMILVVQKIQSF